MGYEHGLRFNARIEKDIIPFLIRNYLWDKDTNLPNKSMIILGWVEKKEDVCETHVVDSRKITPSYWHFTQKRKRTTL